MSSLLRSASVRPVLASIAGVVAFCNGALAQFATRVISYAPAPGQRVQDALFNDPARALGPPGVQGGLSSPDNSKIVTLGGFGGTITLGFDRPIWRNRHNPRGVDFTIYGNAFYAAGDPTRRFAEPGVVEVSRDDNQNGEADDAWYLIPGSHLGVPISREIRQFDAATLNPLWIPPGRTGTWSVEGYRLPSVPFDARPPLLSASAIDESVWGYADLMPTLALGDTDGDDSADDPDAAPDEFYSRADDPLKVGVSAQSAGGSAFSIAWAVNAATGAPPTSSGALDRIDFVRITTGVDFVDALFGEISTEISSVADVSPVYNTDWNADGAVGVQDIFEFLTDWFFGVGEHGGADFDSSEQTSIQDLFAFLLAWFAA